MQLIRSIVVSLIDQQINLLTSLTNNKVLISKTREINFVQTSEAETEASAITSYSISDLLSLISDSITRLIYMFLIQLSTLRLA